MHTDIITSHEGWCTSIHRAPRSLGLTALLHMRARAVEGLHEGDEQLNNEVPMGSICCHTVSHWHRLVALDGSAQWSCC